MLFKCLWTICVCIHYFTTRCPIYGKKYRSLCIYVENPEVSGLPGQCINTFYEPLCVEIFQQTNRTHRQPPSLRLWVWFAVFFFVVFFKEIFCFLSVFSLLKDLVQPTQYTCNYGNTHSNFNNSETSIRSFTQTCKWAISNNKKTTTHTTFLIFSISRVPRFAVTADDGVLQTLRGRLCPVGVKDSRKVPKTSNVRSFFRGWLVERVVSKCVSRKTLSRAKSCYLWSSVATSHHRKKQLAGWKQAQKKSQLSYCVNERPLDTSINIYLYFFLQKIDS